MPLGATRAAFGVNFAVISRHATAITLVILPEKPGHTPLAEFPLDPKHNRTGDHWHIRLEGLPEVFCYGWRVDGPASAFNRFDPSRLLLDPNSTVLSAGEQWAGTCEIDPARTSRRSLYARTGAAYAWGDDVPLNTPAQDSIVYELHVRGFTKHTSAGVQHPGTFRGLIEKIDYLKWLGVTAVELLPVFEFDECDCPFENPITGEKLVNYWGYNPIAFAAPKSAYAASGANHGQDSEFRDLVKALHEAGIEVILDVVFNHTGEGNDEGRTYNFRGLDNELYYLLDDNGQYLNYTGCGNTVNCNHPVVREQILACLRYWVTEMHVDGFRFDLASILGRDRNGRLMASPPVIEMIADDSILSGTKLIAEPWDAAGAYQVGNFPFGKRWAEWNDRFRDDVRRFWCGLPGLAGAMASRLCGSADIFHTQTRQPAHSVNFITAHDGFTLHDLVSYNEKHNEANGEGNRDGHGDNCSWNSGVEGPTDEPEVLQLRLQRAKAMMATLLLSQGTPMLLAGDEFLRTQQGNNNAWCQDNDLSWLNWELNTDQKEFQRFVRELIHIRKRYPVFRRTDYFRGKREDGRADVTWHGAKVNQPDFGLSSCFVACVLDGSLAENEASEVTSPDFYMAMNGSQKSLKVELPPTRDGQAWFWQVNTTAASPQDVLPVDAKDNEQVAFKQTHLEMKPFQLVLLRSGAKVDLPV